LVETNNGWFYFSIGIGILELENRVIYTLNPNAPLGNSLLGKKNHDTITFQNKTFEVINLY
jgi:hypothetical protein